MPLALLRKGGAEAGGAAEVRLDDGIAPLRQRLRPIVPALVVAREGPAVRHHHHRQRLRLPSGGEGEDRAHLQPVAALVADRPHRVRRPHAEMLVENRDALQPAVRGRHEIISAGAIARADMEQEALALVVHRYEPRRPPRQRLVDRLLDVGELRIEPPRPLRRVDVADAEQPGLPRVGDDSVYVVAVDARDLFAHRHGAEVELVDGVEPVAVVDHQRLALLGQEQARDHQPLVLARIGMVEHAKARPVALAVEKLGVAPVIVRADADPHGAGPVRIPALHPLLRLDDAVGLAGRDVDFDDFGPEGDVVGIDRLLEGEPDARRAVVRHPEDVVGDLRRIVPGDLHDLCAAHRHADRAAHVEIDVEHLVDRADADDQPFVVDPAPPVEIALAGGDEGRLCAAEQVDDRQQLAALRGEPGGHHRSVG